MKKILCVAIALTMAIGIVGCSDKEKKNENSNKTSSETVAMGSADVPDSSDTVITTDDTESVGVSILSVHSENFMHGECSVTLLYPRYGDGAHDAFDLAMRNYAMTKFNQHGIMPEDSGLYEILSCDIKSESGYFVSAVVTGQIINHSAAHDTHFAYTVNADTRSGKVYLSEELVGDVELIKSGLAEGKFTQSYGIAELPEAIADGTVTYEYITQSWRSDYGVFPDMYFATDSFGVIAELPHVIGGYAGFEIPYAEVGDMINPVAKGLCGIIVKTD